MGLCGGCWLCLGTAHSCWQKTGIQLEELGQEGWEWGCCGRAGLRVWNS